MDYPCAKFEDFSFSCFGFVVQKKKKSRVKRPTKHIIGHIGDDFYGSDDPTNSVKH